MDELLTGAIATTFGVAGLFFLRFWRATRDRLFGLVAAESQDAAPGTLGQPK